MATNFPDEPARDALHINDRAGERSDLPFLKNKSKKDLPGVKTPVLPEGIHRMWGDTALLKDPVVTDLLKQGRIADTQFGCCGLSVPSVSVECLGYDLFLEIPDHVGQGR